MKKFLSGALIGAAIAGVAVALTTPKKGSELRGDIKDEAIKIKGHGEDMIEKASESLSHAKDSAAETFEHASEKAKETYEKAMESATELKDKVTHKEDKLVIDEEVESMDETESTPK